MKRLRPSAPARALTAAVVGLALGGAGCSEQPWVFRNGVGMPEEPPARIVAEVYEGSECGFGCRPPGAREYCAELARGGRGPSPEGLEGGARYCFVGVALEEDGTPVAIGCQVATAGDDAPIEVVLSPVEGVSRRSGCGDDALDAGARDAGVRDAGTDASVPRDAGPTDAGPRDAGPPPVDAGGQPTEVTLTVEVMPGGRALIRSQTTGRGWDIPPTVFNIGTVSGWTYTITANPDSGSRFDTFVGGGCGTTSPCSVTLAGDTRVDVRFAPE